MFAMLNTAYGDVAMKRVTYFRWHKCFKNGRLSVEDDERSGRPFVFLKCLFDRPKVCFNCHVFANKQV